MTRKSKTITNPKDIMEISSLKESDITLSRLMQMFGEFNEKQRFQPFDLITIPAGVYGPEGKKNKNAFTTTIGIWIYNVFMIEERLFDLFKYINTTIDNKQLKKQINKITTEVVEDRLPVEELDIFLQKSQKLMPLTTALTYSSTEKLYGLSDYMTPKKKELAKKYEKELAVGDVVVAEKMEKELIAEAKKYMGDDPGMDIFYSGARSSIPNHLKNMYIMKGAVTNPDPMAEHKYDIILSNYNDGVSKEEYTALCKSLTSGPYSRARKTQIGGYWEKLFVMAYQDVVIGAPGTDCGTKDTKPVMLTEDNIDGWMYSYIVTKNGLVELTSENRDKYVNTKVEFRFSSLCESKTCICHRCAGNGFNRMKVENVGVAMGMIASKIKNISMKAFHDGTVSTLQIDPVKAFGE